jgi:hypothetical protein
MAGRRKNNGFDMLTTLRDNQEVMQKDITLIRARVESLYCIDPPGPLMQLSTHLSEHRTAKWRERTFFTMLAGAAGTIGSYVWALIFKK